MSFLDKINSAIRNQDSELKVNHWNISTIPKELAHATHIRVLDISDNKISIIENLPPNLETLIARNNQIRHIVDIPSSVTKIDMSVNYIDSIINIPHAIIELNVSRNIIKEFDGTDFTSLVKLEIQYNNLKKIDTSYNQNLIYLNASCNNIIEYKLNEKIRECHFDHNNLEVIGFVPIDCRIFTAKYNNLTSVKYLPPSIVNVDFSFNRLDRLPIWPNSLNSIIINDNKIKTICGIPFRLKELDISNNLLVSLPMLVHVPNVRASGNPIEDNTMETNIAKPTVPIGKQLENDIPDIANFWEAKANKCTEIPVYDGERTKTDVEVKINVHNDNRFPGIGNTIGTCNTKYNPPHMHHMHNTPSAPSAPNNFHNADTYNPLMNIRIKMSKSNPHFIPLKTRIVI